MRLPNRTSSAAFACAATLTVAIACSDTPAQPSVRGDGDPIAYAHAPGHKTKVKNLHSARVRSDGELVDGTAVSATRFNTGTYILSFPAPIDGCAAAANSTSFPGFDFSVLRVAAQISIGTALGGGPDDRSVIVNLFAASDGPSVDSSFSLVLLCP